MPRRTANPVVEPGAAAELIRGLMTGRGMTQRAVAAELGISDRMVRKVLGGVSEGGNYVPRLSALVTKGKAGGVPVARRRNAAGALVPVRGPANTRVIPTVADRPTAARGAYGQTPREHMVGGGWVQTFTAPKTEGVGREQARQAIMGALDSVPGSSSVMFHVYDADGNHATIGSKGGYRVRAALQGMHDEGDDPFNWFDDAGGGDYGDDLGALVRVTIVVMG